MPARQQSSNSIKVRLSVTEESEQYLNCKLMKLRPATDPKNDQGAADQRRERYNGGAVFLESWRHDSHFTAQCRLIQCQMGVRRCRRIPDPPSYYQSCQTEGGEQGARLTTERYYTSSGRSIQAERITPDIQVLQTIPPEARTQEHPVSEVALRGHLKSSGPEKSGSQSFAPPDPKDDGALQDARLHCCAAR